MRNGWKKLIIPFIIWSIIGWLVHIGWHLYVGDLSFRVAFYTPLRSLILSCSVPVNSALWFLPILYLVRLAGNWLIPKFHVHWIIVATLGLCILFKLIHIPFLPSWITKTFWGLFFFACGYWLKDYEEKWWLIVVALVTYIMSLIIPIYAVYGGEAPQWCHILWYPSCTLACILFNNVCRWVSEKTEKFGVWQFSVLSYLGRNAMNFYVPHYLIFAIVYNIVGLYSDAWYPGWQGLLIVTIAYLTLLPSINCLEKYLNRIKTRK